MTDIYAQHTAAFANVSAYVILNKHGANVGTVALKFPKDGAGRLYAYVHWFGIEMVRGMAGGYGYDKRSAAVGDACRKAIKAHENDGWQAADDNALARASFFRILSTNDSLDWTSALERAGFAVLQAV